MRDQLAIGGLAATSLMLAACGQVGGGGAASPAVANKAAPAPSGPFILVIQDHKFTPAEIVVPANTAVAIEVVNKDPLAEEFDSSDLKVEKVIAGGDTGTVRLHPLEPGRYAFIGEYHSDTAKGVVVAQ